MENLEKYGVYCNQDFRELIGCKLIDVISDENDMNGSIIFENEETSARQVLRINDSVLDGEYMHIIPFEETDLDDVGTIWTKMHDVNTEELKVLNNLRVYNTGYVFNETGDKLGTSITYIGEKENGLSFFRSLHMCNDGKLKISDEF